MRCRRPAGEQREHLAGRGVRFGRVDDEPTFEHLRPAFEAFAEFAWQFFTSLSETLRQLGEALALYAHDLRTGATTAVGVAQDGRSVT